ncbi:cyclophilin-like domain-containing protein [Scheffersomyces xylosifermentans]|uniref:cyclophilin-like domain-containing protein n=1 Tax=Scheffersomyces xylosifermentans TaxID=1304137 RepID=UPI00315D917B
MSVLIETTEGNLVVDLYYSSQPLLCLNFIRLCELNYYFFAPFYDLHKDLLVTTGDPNYPSGNGGYSSNYFVDLPEIDTSITQDRVLPVKATVTRELENEETHVGILSFLTKRDAEGRLVVGSQFTISLNPDVSNLAAFGQQIAFGKVQEGYSVLEKINDSVVEDFTSRRLLKDIRITQVHILHSPFPKSLEVEKLKKSASVPSELQIKNIRLPQLLHSDEVEDADVDDIEARNQAYALELVGDLPDYRIKPSPRVLFVAKLNPITTKESLTTIFSRFGNVLGCNIINNVREKGKKTNYGFVEFENQKDTENAYSKLYKDGQAGCVIDGYDVIVDFSQSVRQRR